MARNYISCFVYLDSQESRNLSCPFIPTSNARGEKKNHLVWAGIEPRSLCFNCSQATALTTRPCLFGRSWASMTYLQHKCFTQGANSAQLETFKIVHKPIICSKCPLIISSEWSSRKWLLLLSSSTSLLNRLLVWCLRASAANLAEKNFSFSSH